MKTDYYLKSKTSLGCGFDPNLVYFSDLFELLICFCRNIFFSQLNNNNFQILRFQNCHYYNCENILFS